MKRGFSGATPLGRYLYCAAFTLSGLAAVQACSSEDASEPALSEEQAAPEAWEEAFELGTVLQQAASVCVGGCPQGQLCSNGQCIAPTQCVGGCPQGQLCSNGQCIAPTQ